MARLRGKVVAYGVEQATLSLVSEVNVLVTLPLNSVSGFMWCSWTADVCSRCSFSLISRVFAVAPG